MDRDLFIKMVLEYLSSNSAYILRKYEIIESASVIEDIDIIIKPEHAKSLWHFFKKHRFKRKIDSKFNNIYLYGAKPHTHYVSKEYNLHFDVVTSLIHKSTLTTEKPGFTLFYWIPLDAKIQDQIWKFGTKYKTKYGDIPILSPLFELIHILSHIIFDKDGKYDPFYEDKIEQLMNIVDIDELSYYLKLIFFNFTDELVNLCQLKRVNDIFDEYISFKDY